jgi:molecular chaperone DnaK
VEVTFDIDANGILNVRAQDKASGREQKITITAGSGLSKEEVEKLVKDAQAHTEDDKKRRKLAEAKNQADNLIYQTEKNLTEYGDKVSADDKAKIQEAVAALKTALESTEPDKIEAATQTLMSASHKLAEEMYKKASEATGAQGPETAGGNGAGEAKTDEKVVDAEFEEVDKDKK